jgi:hypothetical protein
MHAGWGPILLSVPAPFLSVLLLTFLGKGVEEGELGLREGASGRGAGCLFLTATAEEKIQCLLGGTGWWGIR